MRLLRKTLLVMMVLLLAGCSQRMKEFSHAGIVVSVPSSYNFREMDSKIEMFLYSEVKGLSVDVVGAQNKEELAEHVEITTLEEFAQDLLYDYSFEDAFYDNGIYFMTAEVDLENGRMFEQHAFLDDGNNFWWLVFVSAARDRSLYEDEFRQWAGKVRFQ